MRRAVRYRLISLAFLSTSLLSPAQSSSTEPRNEVRKIVIHSSRDGLGKPQDDTIIISRNKYGFRLNQKPVSPTLVDTLVNSLRATLIAEPSASNLGITEAWLKSEVAGHEGQLQSQHFPPTQEQRDLFESSFTNLKLVSEILPRLFPDFTDHLRSVLITDDYPYIVVEVFLNNGSKITALSGSQYPFMLPWKLGDHKDETFNADISRAIAALLPKETVNKERLEDGYMASELAAEVMLSIQSKWNRLAAEYLASYSLALLQTKYQVTSPNLDVSTDREYDSTRKELNLHATLRKPSFPPNVSYSLVLRAANGKLEGSEEFLENAGKYENLVFSVPWLNEQIQQNDLRISYVYNASFSEKALGAFITQPGLELQANLAEVLLAFHVM